METLKPYRTPFRAWEERRWSREVLRLPDPDPTLSFASSTYTLLDKLPAVQAAPEQVRRELQAYEAAMNPEATEQLEGGSVDVGIRMLVSNQFDLDPELRADATKLDLDERWHENAARALKAWIYRHAKIERLIYTSSFEIFVKETLRDPSAEVSDAKQFLATTVTETLISSFMSDLPRDPSVQEAVRIFAAGHAKDESVHSAYLRMAATQCLTKWPPGLARLALLSVPEIVEAFMSPDLNGLEAALKQYPRVFPAPKAILHGVAMPSPESMKAAARPLLVTLRSLDVFKDDDVATAFRNAGLL